MSGFIERLLLIILLLPIGTNGCVILPIPTPAHGGYGLITEQTLELLKPGQATRADVLLRLGDPSERIDEDRFFIYQWERIHGYLLWAIGARGAAVGDVLPGIQSHFLVMEFTTDNQLKRFQFIDPWLFQDSRKHLDELIAEWKRPPIISE